MGDKKSERGRDDRMRKLTEGDGGSWVNLSSKSSQSRPIPISSLPRQESLSPWPCLPLCLWRKDGARLSMIGDGHYLNTILEPGPSPLATAERLETTLMRREMMGQPATPSSFINSDKMVSTLCRNAQQPPSTSTFSQCATHCAFVYRAFLSFLFISSSYFCFIGCLYSARSIAIPAFDTQRPCVSLFNILSLLLSVWLRGANGSCLSLPTRCSSEGWPEFSSGEIDRTLRCCALCCHAPPQQVGKSEGCWLAHSGRPQGRGCLEAPHAHRGGHSTLHANEAKRSPCASGHYHAKLWKVKKNPGGTWCLCAEKYTGTHRDMKTHG